MPRKPLAAIAAGLALTAAVLVAAPATATVAASDPNCVSYVGSKIINSSRSTTAILVSKTTDPYADGQGWCRLAHGYSTRGKSFYVPTGYTCDNGYYYWHQGWHALVADLSLYCH